MPDPAHSDRYDQALLWAAQLHRGQFRKGKPVPTISHLISVSALQHDAIEDAGQDHASIADRFGAAVADIVVACTDTDGPIAPGAQKPPPQPRRARSSWWSASRSSSSRWRSAGSGVGSAS